MEVIKFISEKGFNRRCKQHPSITCEFICLDEDAKDRFICFKCRETHSIPLEKLISISCILDSNENQFLQTYPPLIDPKLSKKLKSVIQQQLMEEIDAYFKKLREDIEKEINAAQHLAKELFIKQQQSTHELLDEYLRIAEIEKLKKLTFSEKEEVEKDLNNFIKQKWNQAEENQRIMLDFMNQQETEYKYSSTEPNRIAEQISDSIKSINFFIQESIFKIIKSTYGSSPYVEITKIDDSTYQLKQGTYTSESSQVYLDPVLNPSSKYILHIELEAKSRNMNNYFSFGLVKDEGKDNDYACKQGMCYSDYFNSYGVTQYIKGNPMQSESNVIGKHSFEVRIHLDQNLLRVASLPDYSSIAELDNPNKIDPKVNYRFFLTMKNKGDIIRINKMFVVINLV